MDQDTFLVLRITGGSPESFDPLGTKSDGGTLSAGEVEYRVDEVSLDRQDERELRRDPEVAGLARPCPLRLIEPVAMSEADGAAEHVHGATWGVFVTGALQSPFVGNGVTVAVLDTGIDATHEAFRGVELIERDFTGEGNGDQRGHGTHVAGTIFGQTTQGVRYGVAPGVRRALIGKVIGKDHNATTAELVDAVQWAVAGGAQIINMSLGFNFPGLVKWWTKRGMETDLATSQALAQYRDNVRLFDKLVGLLGAGAPHGRSALIVAAAGNESKRDVRSDYAIEVSPPAAADGVVSVAALRSAGPPHSALSVAHFSNVRAAVAAPGMGVYSAKRGGGYFFDSGTSMASPHVAGIAALWAERQLQRNGVVNIEGLDSRLRGSTRLDRLQDAQYVDVGEGLVTAPSD